MCVIIHLPAGAKINFAMLKNAVHNNWHSYGLVTRIDGKLDIKRVVPKSGEVDPVEVANALDKDEEFERILHLRHNTAGATTMKNCHPFDVYSDNDRQVVFMHNGTFFDYKPKKFDKDGKLEDDNDGPSDSLSFAEENITPMLVRSNGSIQDAFFQKVTRKFWAHNNRGLLISSDEDPWFIGDDWKKIEGTNGGELRVSNDHYFDKVTRGPEKDRRDKAEKLRKEEEAKSKKGNGKFHESNNKMAQGTSMTPVGNLFKNPVTYAVAPLSEFDFSLSKLSTTPANICNDWDVYDREHLISLGNLDKSEWEQLYNDKSTAIFVMDYLSSDYANLYAEFTDLEDKVRRQEKVIEEMAMKLKKGVA